MARQISTSYRTLANMSKIGQDEELIIGSIRRLDSWINRNGWAGYDPSGLIEKIYSIFGRNKGEAYMARMESIYQSLCREEK